MAGFASSSDTLGQPVSYSSIPALEPLESVYARRESYAGPTNESNWVIPGRLLVGAFPATPNDTETTTLLYSILSEGIGTFVCLQEEFVLRGVGEPLWRSGQALRPYFRDVVQISRRVEAVKRDKPWAAPQFVLADSLSFLHFPIRDLSTGSDEGVMGLALDLCERIARGEVIYMHCWGGHGRTGTVVSVVLALLYGLSAEEAMFRCQFLHDLRRIPIAVGSPQTQPQREQVTRLVAVWRESAMLLGGGADVAVGEEEEGSLMRIGSEADGSLMRMSSEADAGLPRAGGGGWDVSDGPLASSSAHHHHDLAHGYGLGSPRLLSSGSSVGGSGVVGGGGEVLGLLQVQAVVVGGGLQHHHHQRP